ncbi:MAG: copper-binding protein [Xanthomonadaceae bacterium]|uniref:copper-binding protein n=1 Tax=Bradyrhizobium sp. TaxID=376 RepID=UPI001C29167A|nr:copper-binding protein [Bradyrhizobium sp.]MBU6416127.1 copper-binding protein [Xanthomonadaceae bacterium]MBU6464495.1 copper-binding protein [Pseudomonadota bacterium]MDE2069173.1 copper-binding protein [Bradyrhizobium sp.]MDE2242948.1 copper-binding protein [Bradyrhizobium sp.]MDE2470448.1 copper-binding protein [Bradyrhizobium sp.]
MKLARIVLAGAMLVAAPSITLAQQSSTGMISMINRIDNFIVIRQTPSGTVGASGGGATEQQFAVAANLLDSVHAGDKVKFDFNDANGKKTITKIERDKNL